MGLEMILIERGKHADRDDIYINMQEERVDRDGGPEARKEDIHSFWVKNDCNSNLICSA
jgi:hypothetical protein